MPLSQAEKRRLWAPACVKRARPHLHDAYQALDDCMHHWSYAPKEGQTWAGNCRPVTGGNDYSIHSYFGDAYFWTWTGVRIQIACACDYNSLANPYGAVLRTDMPRAMVDAILAIRTNSGEQVWQWGGYFSGNKDAMHYEIACSPADLATGINWSTVAGHDAPAPPPQGDDDVKQRFYQIRDEANISKPHPEKGAAIWTTSDGVEAKFVNEPAWVHLGNLGWWDRSTVELIPESAHNWLVSDSNTAVVEAITAEIKRQLEDVTVDGGSGNLTPETIDTIAKAVLDAEAARLKA